MEVFKARWERFVVSLFFPIEQNKFSACLISQHACRSNFFSDFWSDLFLSPACPRDVFKPKPEGHKVTGSKPVSADMKFFFFRLPSPWGRPHKSLEGEASVLMKLSIEVLYNELLSSRPLLFTAR